jgi:hypothetical protein
MSDYTVFPSGLGFYGGITLAYGVGLHEDFNATLQMSEPMRADYINLLEHRVAHLENVVNQLEQLILYPSGHINPTLDRTSLPADGDYYHSTNHSILASGVNWLIENEAISSVPGYPFYVGTIS